jgi:hypothetical protein
MKRRVEKRGPQLLVALTSELERIGASEAVLVRVVEGDNPQIVLSCPLTFEEALDSTLTDHAEALRTLATMPSNGRAEGEA